MAMVTSSYHKGQVSVQHAQVMSKGYSWIFTRSLLNSWKHTVDVSSVEGCGAPLSLVSCLSAQTPFGGIPEGLHGRPV